MRLDVISIIYTISVFHMCYGKSIVNYYYLVTAYYRGVSLFSVQRHLAEKFNTMILHLIISKHKFHFIAAQKNIGIKVSHNITDFLELKKLCCFVFTLSVLLRLNKLSAYPDDLA